MQPAAFFDLDRTLLSVNSGALWLRRERRAGRVTLRQMADAARALFLYKLGVVDMETALRKALAVYRGQSEAELAGWTRDWYLREVAHRVAPGARPALARHRQAGHPLVLLTSSSPYLSALVASDLRLDAWLCQRYEVVDGLLTGEPVRPFCYAEGKVVHAERWAAGAGVDLDRSYFYSDSFTDLPMLVRVGHPRVVNPDLRLRRHARRRGWPVLDWSREGSEAPEELVTPSAG